MAKDDQNNETQENKKNGIIRDHNSQLWEFNCFVIRVYIMYWAIRGK